MTASAVEMIGLIAACGGAAAALLVPDLRARHACMALALVAAPALLLGDVWDRPQVEDLRDQPALVALGVLTAAAVIAAAAAVFRRRPVVFAFAAFAALPLRVPVQFGGETSNLLIPLYLVIGAGFLASAWRAWDDARAAGTAADGARPPGEPGAVTWLRRLLAATLVLYAVQAAYSEDVSNAIENACFFLAPFAVLFALLVELRWTRRMLVAALAAMVATGVVFAAVAYVEIAVRDLIFNRELLESNQIHLYFRVNSLFHDPNVLGRYLALTLVALGAVLCRARGPTAWGLAATAMILLGALALSFSMTSFAALIAGLLVVAWLRFGLRSALLASAVAVVGAAAFIGLGGLERSELGPSRGIDEETSGRVDLVEGGAELAVERPIAGWGSGSFGAAFVREIQVARTTTSHSEPLTVAAEQGIVGLVVYLALLAASLAVVLGRAAGASAGRSAVAAAYVAMLVHSLGYAGFAIDPGTWALLAVGVALARAAATAPGMALPAAASPDPRPRPAAA